MKVGDSNLNNAAASQLGQARQTEAVAPGGAKKATGAQAQSQTDRVQLSNLSGQLLQLAGVDSPERAARVEQLAADFKAGRYQPNAAATSRGIVDDAMRK